MPQLTVHLGTSMGTSLLASHVESFLSTVVVECTHPISNNSGDTVVQLHLHGKLHPLVSIVKSHFKL